MANFTSTQNFTEIKNIIDGTLFLKDGSAALIIEVYSTNFSLLSTEEQAAKIFAYASFLNSLSFPLQIVVHNRRVNISSYITLLNGEIEKITDSKLSDYMKKYRDFVQQLVTQNTVLDKRFYLVIPQYTYEIKSTNNEEDDSKNISQALKVKADSILTQFQRLGLNTRILNNDEIVNLFKNFYKPEGGKNLNV